MEKQFVFNSLLNRKTVKSVKDKRYVIKLRSSTDIDRTTARSLQRELSAHFLLLQDNLHLRLGSAVRQALV